MPDRPQWLENLNKRYSGWLADQLTHREQWPQNPYGVGATGAGPGAEEASANIADTVMAAGQAAAFAPLLGASPLVGAGLGLALPHLAGRNQNIDDLLNFPPIGMAAIPAIANPNKGRSLKSLTTGLKFLDARRLKVDRIARDLTKQHESLPLYIPDKTSLPDDTPVLRSTILTALDDPKIPNKMTSQQAEAFLAKYPGIKQTEVDFLGIKDFVRSKPKFTKDELRKFVDDNNLDIIENMRVEETAREAAITNELSDIYKRLYSYDEVPPVNDAARIEQAQLRKRRDALEHELNIERTRNTNPTKYGPRSEYYDLVLPGDYSRYREITFIKRPSAKAKQPTPKENFYAPHWPEPNVIAHTRLTDRVLPNGKKILFIEEAQSDWHTRARKNVGSWLDSPQGKIDTYLREIGLESYAYDKATLALMNQSTQSKRASIPPPQANEYPDLVLKRILRLAADEGYDGIGWTTGSQQASRYNKVLHDKVDWVSYNISGTTLTVKPKGGIEYTKYVSPHSLPNYLGMDAAKKLLAKTVQGGRLSGEGLAVGPRGYSDIYDQRMRQAAMKLGKKFGLSVEEDKLDVESMFHYGLEPTAYLPYGPRMEPIHTVMLPTQAKEAVKSKPFPLFQTAAGAFGLRELTRQQLDEERRKKRLKGF